jgi:hypothetical protein
MKVRMAFARLVPRSMKARRSLRVAMLPLLSVFWLVLGPVAYADETFPATGTDEITFSPVSTRTADGNTFIDFTYVESWQGTIVGTRVGSGSLVIHPDGSLNAKASGVFTGTIAGLSGTATMNATASGTFASASAIFTVTDGTGGLAGVHVQGSDMGSAIGPTTFAATYSAKVHFSGP